VARPWVQSPRPNTETGGKLRAAVNAEPAIAFDPDADRDHRIRLYQERNELLARLRPGDLHESHLPQERKAELLDLAATFHAQQRATGTRGR
jgi:hypothetical protein